MKRLVIWLCLLVFLVAFFPSVKTETNLLTLKWQTSSLTRYGHFHPSMGDVDNDGTQEIAVKHGDYVHVLNGKTGTLEWRSPGDGVGGTTMLELADLNNDGTPEIIYCGTNLSVYARDGFGELLWKSNPVNGEGWAGTPIVTCDINGDGYAEIYVVTKDTSPPFTACITKLDSSGNILTTSEICYKPCWGGLALADANFDGNFEVYLGDISSSGGPGGSSTPYPNNPARGLSCYDADTLSTIWTRGDLYHSTPAPVLIDVTGDGNLEVIGNNIMNNGACVIDATNGQDIYNWKGTPINNHAKGTVWDIDLDGHIELISAWGYSDNTRCTKDFTVLDLVTGEIDYRASEINNWITYPPTVGDVDGDGLLDILVATSTEDGHGEVGQGIFYVYNHNYEILQTINDFPYGEQLWEPYCVDCDGDGYNEVIIGNSRGKVWCYDTPAKRPTPAPKPWSAWYSPYRQGASINVNIPNPKTSDYQLSLQVNGSGSILPIQGIHGPFAAGTVVTVTASAYEDWSFSHWILDEENVGSTNPFTITMDDDHLLTAVFAENPPVLVNNDIYVVVGDSTYHIQIASNLDINNFSFNPPPNNNLNFSVEGESGTVGVCNITIPVELMSGTFSIYKDDVLLAKNVDYTETYNGTHYLFSLTYEHSTHMIEIHSTTVIPELLSIMLITKLVIITLAVFILNRRKKTIKA